MTAADQGHRAAHRRAGPADASRAALAASLKDRAENVMIVDLMRNDLGRVCEYGSIVRPALNEPQAPPACGISYRRCAAGCARTPATPTSSARRFPPGSVTGAPKIQAMRVIAELEAGGREAYTGAIGFASPVAGLELNVAIRTFEMNGDRIWMERAAASWPTRSLRTSWRSASFKARPVIAAAGARPIEEPRVNTRRPGDRPWPATPTAPTPPSASSRRSLVRGGVPVDLRRAPDAAGTQRAGPVRDIAPTGLHERALPRGTAPRSLQRLRLTRTPAAPGRGRGRSRAARGRACG